MDILDLIKEGKVKRFFQVRNKLSFKGAVYHITQRAPGREPLFLEEADYLRMIKLMKEKSTKFSLDIFSFALMPNHLHLLIRLNEANLSEAMKNLFETYADYFNKKYARKGPVFCKPYRGAMCMDDSYLLAASIYIHLNPMKARLIDNPFEYRWSSSALYRVGEEEKKTFVKYQFILKILDSDIIEAKKLYGELIKSMSKTKVKNVLEDSKGLDVFRKKLLKYLKKIVKGEKREKFLSAVLDDEMLDKKIDELIKKKRLTRPHEIQARKFLIEQLKSRGYKITEIAQMLKISCRSIYNVLNFTKQASLKV